MKFEKRRKNRDIISTLQKSRFYNLAKEFAVEIISSGTVMKFIREIEDCPDFETELAITQVFLIRDERLDKISEM